MQSIEIDAKTIEEAVSKACKELNTTEDKLNIEILESMSSKVMSFFSGKKVKIRASLVESALQPKQDAVHSLKEILQTIVKEIYTEASVEVKTEQDEIVMNIVGDGSGIFIGKKGQTLVAFQYLINKIRMNKFRDECPHVNVDSESYRSRHVESLVSLEKRLSEKARQVGGPVTTNLLSSADRRIIHMTLKKDDGLITRSKGEGSLKKVIISPRQ